MLGRRRRLSIEVAVLLCVSYPRWRELSLDLHPHQTYMNTYVNVFYFIRSEEDTCSIAARNASYAAMIMSVM